MYSTCAVDGLTHVSDGDMAKTRIGRSHTHNLDVAAWFGASGPWGAWNIKVLDGRAGRRIQDLDMMRRDTGVGGDKMYVLGHAECVLLVFERFPCCDVETDRWGIRLDLRWCSDIGEWCPSFPCWGSLDRINRRRQVQSLELDTDGWRRHFVSALVRDDKVCR